MPYHAVTPAIDRYNEKEKVERMIYKSNSHRLRLHVRFQPGIPKLEEAIWVDYQTGSDVIRELDFALNDLFIDHMS